MANFVPKKAIQITNTPAGSIAATNVQAAIDELDTEKAALGANSDITSLSGLTTPLSISQGGTGNTQGCGAINTNRLVIGATDFFFGGGAIGGASTWSQSGFGGTIGTITGGTGEANHPGVSILRSAAAVNSGYRFTTSYTDFSIAGGETTEFIFYPITLTNSIIRMGFQDSATSSAVTDGVYIFIAGTTLSGETSAASSTSTTGTTYTISASTWYRAKIAVNSNATRVDFYLYAENGTQLWTNFLTTNIPVTAGQETGHGILAYNTGSSVVEIVKIDYMNLYIDRNLVR